MTNNYLASHVLLDQLAAEGTRFIFGSQGSANSPFVAAALESRSDIHYLVALHEEIAACMAIGYAQASGRPGVVTLPAATGLINSLSSLYNAKHARVPLVVIADQQDTQIINDEPPLSGDLCELARPVCKWVRELKSANEISRLLRRAFHEALSPPKGPVFLSLPVNLLMTQAVSRTISPPQTSPMGPADASFLKKAAMALVSAKNPCIVAGNEVSLYRARKEVVALAEVLGCPVFSEPLPTGVNFPNRHPNFAGVLPLDLYRASELLANHDVLLVLGMQTRLPARPQEPPLVPSGCKVIQINIEAGLAGRTLPAEMIAIADIGESLSRLRAEVQLIVDSNWVAAVKKRSQETVDMIADRKQQVEDATHYPGPSAPIPLTWLLKLLDAVRPLKSIIVSDLVAPESDPFEILSLDSSSAFFSSNGGCGGYGFSAALGVQWSSPDTPVVCIASDESALYYPQVFWTASHYGLRVKFILVNNLGRSSYSVRMAPIPESPGRVLLDNPAIDYPELAQSMRVPAASVATMGELEPALKTMFETPGPYLLDVHIDSQ
jgi:benzoylformate decarboxylase